jgi:hypothetical protein
VPIYRGEGGSGSSSGGSSGGGADGGIIDAPANGVVHGRKDYGWVPLETKDIALTSPNIGSTTQEEANTYFYDEIEALKQSGGGGGGTGGSTDWPDITNKPPEISNLAG